MAGRGADAAWQLDVEPLRGGSLEADLALRDFTVNAIAEPIEGGAPIDPLGGLADLAARRLRMAGAERVRRGPSAGAAAGAGGGRAGSGAGGARPLRGARAQAEGLAAYRPSAYSWSCGGSSPRQRALTGLEMMGELGATAVVLPELEALRGVEQSRFHHRDVYGHTLEVFEQTIELTTACAGDAAERGWRHRCSIGQRWTRCWRSRWRIELTRGDALRWGALLHDAAKPLTREVRPSDGRVTFSGHDVRGAELARAVLGRLRASERLRAHVAALVRHHLRLGFLVHEPQPLSRADGVRIPARLLAGRGGRDAPVGRRSPGHARGPRAGVDRRTHARRARAACRRAALACRGPASATCAGG